MKSDSEYEPAQENNEEYEDVHVDDHLHLKKASSSESIQIIHVCRKKDKCRKQASLSASDISLIDKVVEKNYKNTRFRYLSIIISAILSCIVTICLMVLNETILGEKKAVPEIVPLAFIITCVTVISVYVSKFTLLKITRKLIQSQFNQPWTFEFQPDEVFNTLTFKLKEHQDKVMIDYKSSKKIQLKGKCCLKQNIALNHNDMCCTLSETKKMTLKKKWFGEIYESEEKRRQENLNNLGIKKRLFSTKNSKRSIININDSFFNDQEQNENTYRKKDIEQIFDLSDKESRNAVSFYYNFLMENCFESLTVQEANLNRMKRESMQGANTSTRLRGRRF